MSARIIVQSGISAGTSHWIERSVIRIGSDPTMDLTIPTSELASHAMTLEFREGVYRVHNRSDKAIHLGGQTIESGSAERWFDTDLIEIPGAVTLALDLGDDPSPSPKPSDRATAPWHGAAVPPEKAGQNESAPRRDAGQQESSSLLLQLGVIIGCVVISTLLLTKDRWMGTSEEAKSLPSFTQVVQRARQQPSFDEPLLQRFQFAEAAMIRRHEDVARTYFSRVRSQLLRDRAQADGTLRSSDADALSDQMLRWVEHRLSEL